MFVALNSSQMRRDYYRGSQDCLAETRRTSTSSLYSGIYYNNIIRSHIKPIVHTKLIRKFYFVEFRHKR